MKYHIALGRPLNLEEISRDAAERKRPRHVMWALSQRLEATVHEPGSEPVLPLDKLRAKIAGRPEHWAMARALSSQLGSEDVVFCTGEDIGVPIATLCGAKASRPKIVVLTHNINRPRGRVSLKLFGLAERIDLFITYARPQYDFLRRFLKLPEDRLCMLADQTDMQFFTPGSPSPDKRRPIVASVGLEMRDYRTLAAATSDLEVDVKISGFSTDAVALGRAFPDTLPENMSRRFYEWPELVQLYRDADVVVVSLIESKYCAGITTIMEAMACRRPVIVTNTQGISEYVAPPGIATVVNPDDAAAMRQAIVNLLQNPQEAEAQAQRGYEYALKHYNSDDYVEVLASQLMRVGGELGVTLTRQGQALPV